MEMADAASAVIREAVDQVWEVLSPSGGKSDLSTQAGDGLGGYRPTRNESFVQLGDVAPSLSSLLQRDYFRKRLFPEVLPKYVLAAGSFSSY